MTDITITVTNGDGKEVVLPSVVWAMVRILVDGREKIVRQEKGCVELHYHAPSVSTHEVHGKLFSQVGLERSSK